MLNYVHVCIYVHMHLYKRTINMATRIVKNLFQYCQDFVKFWQLAKRAACTHCQSINCKRQLKEENCD